MISDTIRRYTYSGSGKCRFSKTDSASFDLLYEEDTYDRYDSEDYSESKFGMKYKKDIREGRWAGFAMNHSLTESAEFSVVQLASHSTDGMLSFGQPVSDNTGAEVFFGGSSSHYKDYSTNNSKSADWGLRVNYDMGGFSYVEVTYKNSETDYPSSYLLDANGYETSVARSDSISVFTVAVTKTFSLMPMSLMQLSAEKTENRSDSNQYYDWYDPVLKDYFIKITPDHETYSDFNWTAYYMRSLNNRTTVSIFYMRDKTEYPNMFIDTGDITVEPHTGLATTLIYKHVNLQYTLANDTTLDLSHAIIDSSANSADYAYSQKLTSIGISTAF